MWKYLILEYIGQKFPKVLPKNSKVWTLNIVVQRSYHIKPTTEKSLDYSLRPYHEMGTMTKWLNSPWWLSLSFDTSYQGDQYSPGIIPLAIKDVFSMIQDVSSLDLFYFWDLTILIASYI